VGEYSGLEAHGSTLYFKLKLTLYISGPYVPAQKLLSLPTKPYCTLPKSLDANGVLNVSA
jgi:hypothetical protein